MLPMWKYPIPILNANWELATLELATLPHFHILQTTPTAGAHPALSRLRRSLRSGGYVATHGRGALVATDDGEGAVATQSAVDGADARRLENVALLQIVDTSLPCVAAPRPNTALALWRRARPAGHPAARIAA